MTLPTSARPNTTATQGRNIVVSQRDACESNQDNARGNHPMVYSRDLIDRTSAHLPTL
jgi:hypothetical protein